MYFLINFDSKLITGNLGSLPLIIVPAVCKEKGSPFGDPNVCREYAMAYASLSMAVCTFTWKISYDYLFEVDLIK